MTRASGGSGVAILACDNVSVTANDFPNAVGVILDRGGNTNVIQSGNRIGNPLTLQPASTIG